MTIEQKAQAYDVAIERAKKVLLDCTSEEQKVVEYITPELKENEDEKIRQTLIQAYSELRNKRGGNYKWREEITYDMLISWLEKQGENHIVGNNEMVKHAWSEEDKLMLNDIITCNERHGYLTAENITWLKSIKDRVQPKVEWGEEDEKIYNKICGLIHAAAFANCETDEDGKELNEYAKMMHLLKLLKEKVQPQVEWSEEDEKTWKELIEEVKDQLNYVPAPDCRDEEDEKALKQLNKWLTWLKSLKPQSNQEWSEEDEHRINDTIYFLETAKKHYASTMELDACIDWLKSLRPQKQWKPSEEQLRELENVFSPNTDSWDEDILRELYEQLKKLK